MLESGDLYSLCNTELTVVLVVVICIFSSVGVLMLVFFGKFLANQKWG